MAKKSRRQKIIEPLLEKFAPELEKGFLESVDLLRADADFKRIVDRLSVGDVQGAVAALHIEPGAFNAYQRAIVGAYTAGGDAGAQSMPKRRPNGQKFVVRFDAQNPDAERWLRDHSSNAITEIIDDQRVMVRNAMTQGMADGLNPRTVALDIVGRYDKRVGKRTGGLIGLTSRQEKIVRNVSRALKSKDPAELHRYLDYKLRDKRYDRHVTKFLRDGTPISAETQLRMVSRYKDSLLRFRGETIGRTEAMASLHHGRYQSFAQAVSDGEVEAKEIIRSWQSAMDNRVRHSHVEMNGQEVGLNEYYTTPSGAKLLHPGDPNGPPEEIINCRCTEDIRIDFLSRLR